jgi:exopolysaccharide production protein ExoZ
MGKLRSIQCLRALAACSVVLFHATHTRFAVGAAGVDLFFVISGFIMATVGVGRSAGEFLRDRAWRIFPLWFVAVIPWLVAFRPTGPRLWVSLTFWPIYGGQFYYSPLTVGWTLSFELLFYLAFALALWSRPLVPLTAFALCCVGGAVFGGALLGFLGSPVIFEFLAGVVIAKLPKRPALALPCILAAAAILAANHLPLYLRAVVLTPDLAIWRLLLWGVPGALLVYGALSAEPWFVKAGPLVLLGDASYSIYLFHQIPLRISGIPWPLGAATGVGCGIAAYFIVERQLPALRTSRKNLHDKLIADHIVRDGRAARLPCDLDSDRAG